MNSLGAERKEALKKWTGRVLVSLLTLSLYGAMRLVAVETLAQLNKERLDKVDESLMNEKEVTQLQSRLTRMEENQVKIREALARLEARNGE